MFRYLFWDYIYSCVFYVVIFKRKLFPPYTVCAVSSAKPQDQDHLKSSIYIILQIISVPIYCIGTYQHKTKIVTATCFGWCKWPSSGSTHKGYIHILLRIYTFTVQSKGKMNIQEWRVSLLSVTHNIVIAIFYCLANSFDLI